MLVVSGCATSQWRWKSVDPTPSIAFNEAYAQCQEKSLTERQVQYCLMNKGWIWDRE